MRRSLSSAEQSSSCRRFPPHDSPPLSIAVKRLPLSTSTSHRTAQRLHRATADHGPQSPYGRSTQSSQPSSSSSSRSLSSARRPALVLVREPACARLQVGRRQEGRPQVRARETHLSCVSALPPKEVTLRSVSECNASISAGCSVTHRNADASALSLGRPAWASWISLSGGILLQSTFTCITDISTDASPPDTPAASRVARHAKDAYASNTNAFSVAHAEAAAESNEPLLIPPTRPPSPRSRASTASSDRCRCLRRLEAISTMTSTVGNIACPAGAP